MKSVIRASKEIIALKRILHRIKWLKSDLEQIYFGTEEIQNTAGRLRLRIVQLQGYISMQMDVITSPLLDIPYEITHFTQKEIDIGYATIEIPMSQGPMRFDHDGDFMSFYARYVLFLHNGKIVPLTSSNISMINREARPV